MKNALSYKGFFGSVEFSDEKNILFGRIIDIDERIKYEGFDVKTLRQNFENVVDEYIETCTKIGKKPEKTYRGIFNVRINPSLHRQLALLSVSSGKTLNATVEEAIQRYLN